MAGFDLIARIKLVDQMSPGLRTATRYVGEMRRATELTKAATTGYASATDSLRSSLSRVTSPSQQFRREMNESRNSLLGVRTAFLSLGRSMAGGLAFGAIGAGAIGIGATLAAGISASVKGLKLASDAEQANIAFTTMLGSAAKAKTFLAQLTEFANKTPFEMPQLRDASKRLLAFGFASKQIIPMMTGLGNAAAGLGLGADGIDRLSLAIGQIKAKGKLQGDEAMQLTEAGIPVWDILAKKVKTTTSKMIELSSKGLVPANFAIKTLIEGLNERFPKMMDKQSKSLAGMYSTIKDTFSSKILTKWGQGIADGIRPNLTKMLTWINSNGRAIDQWGARLRSIAASGSSFFSNMVSSATQYLDKLFKRPEFKSIQTIQGKIKYVFDDIQKVFNDWWSASGRQVFEEGSSRITKALLSTLENSLPQMIDIGTKLGSGVAAGMWSGMQQSKSLGWFFKVRDFMTPQFMDDFWNWSGNQLGLKGNSAPSTPSDIKLTMPDFGLNGGGGGTTVTQSLGPRTVTNNIRVDMTGSTVRNDADIDRIAKQIAKHVAVAY
ncbi:tape measure protein [Paenibacillus sp. P22]|uniref:tape measure protein n=1 Tax=Paenibacillus sp. P22 TaxID=483908 RepID=UPI00038F6366|nr:tape measure protein [Paenibacillus sp. P22]CDN43475.1 hypothetical protein BN871_CZ_00460 [Paenibacillus sp. P22]